MTSLTVTIEKMLKLSKHKKAPDATTFELTGEGALIFNELIDCIKEKKLHKFYDIKSDSGCRVIADMASAMAVDHVVDVFLQRTPMNRKYARKLCRLALFEPFLLLDDSGSMNHLSEIKPGELRKDDLKHILEELANSVPLFCPKGMHKRWLNHVDQQQNNMMDVEKITKMVDIPWGPGTPLGEQLEAQITKPHIIDRLSQGKKLNKPVLVIIVTDGAPNSKQAVKDAIVRTVKALEKAKYGLGGISLQFAQAGKDAGATEFLGELDSWRRFFGSNYGKSIDATSSYEIEKEEARSCGFTDLSFPIWLLKLLLGPICAEFDKMDEKKAKTAFYRDAARRSSTMPRSRRTHSSK